MIYRIYKVYGVNSMEDLQDLLARLAYKSWNSSLIVLGYDDEAAGTIFCCQEIVNYCSWRISTAGFYKAACIRMVDAVVIAWWLVISRIYKVYGVDSMEDVLFMVLIRPYKIKIVVDCAAKEIVNTARGYIYCWVYKQQVLDVDASLLDAYDWAICFDGSSIRSSRLMMLVRVYAANTSLLLPDFINASASCISTARTDSIKLKKAVFGFIEDVITKTIDYHLFDVVVKFHREIHDLNFRGSSCKNLFVLSSSNRGRLLGFTDLMRQKNKRMKQERLIQHYGILKDLKSNSSYLLI
ncbi:hypothetical protein Tco_0492570 [Tanacetum coccineum]